MTDQDELNMYLYGTKTPQRAAQAPAKKEEKVEEDRCGRMPTLLLASPFCGGGGHTSLV